MSTNELDSALRRAGRLSLLAETGRAIGLAAAVFVAACLLALAADAVLGLTAWGLITLDCLLGGLFVAGVVYVGWTVYRNGFQPRRLARLIERRLDVQDNTIINAVDLADRPHEAASPELIQTSVSRGNALAGSLSVGRVVDARALGKALLAAGLAAVVLLGCYLAVPGVFRAVLPRLLHPGADYPPFTLIRFHVRTEPAKIYQGHPATIRAELSGQDVPDQANVVFVDGPARQSLPMLRAESGQFALHVERAERSRRFFISTPAGRSELHDLTVLPVPVFQGVTVRYEFPSYTGWAGSSHPLDALGIRSLEGTTVTVEVKSNLPLRSGTISLTPAAAGGKAVEAAMRPGESDAAVVSGSFPLRFSGRYRMSLLAADGTPGNDVLEGPLTCTSDAPPQVQILEPEPEVIAPANWTVPVTVAASDDVAVERIVLFRGVNGWGPTPIRLKLQATGATYATARYGFDLAALGARGGDVITYYASAFDNHPSGTHFADTPTQIIRVVSEADYLAFARTQYRMEQVLAELDEFRRQLDELSRRREELIRELDALEKKIEDAGGRVSDADRKKLDELDAKHAAYVKDSRELAEQLRRRAEQPRIYDLEDAYAEMLRRTAEKLADQAEAGEQLRRGYQDMKKRRPENREEARHVAAARRQLEQDRQSLEPRREQVELAREQLDRLRRADEMVAAVERIAAVAAQQRDLADRLGQFRNKERLSPTEQIRARRLAQEQADLQRKLDEARKELDRLSEKNERDLPQMAKSCKLLSRQIGGMQVARDQSDAARLAQAGQGRYAHRAADAAAKKLESLMRETKGQEGAILAGADDLDGMLQLARARIAEALRQLGQGRGIPGLSGIGGVGAGNAGSMALVGLVGPHATGGQPAAMIAGAGRTDGQGRGVGRGQTGSAAPAERLTPRVAAGRGAGAAGMPGVPVRYRPQAEAYFRRLADESK